MSFLLRFFSKSSRKRKDIPSLSARQIPLSPGLFRGVQPAVGFALDGHHAIAQRRGDQEAVEGPRRGVADRGGVDGVDCRCAAAAAAGNSIEPQRRQGEVVKHS